MAILHKNINAEGDIHNPKWFSGANNGDVAWRNELGVLESTDELVLPAALDFVDGSVAPPTSNSGDIYVLSSGGSVNAGWGTVALGDWVRYDGTTWNVITPQKSSLCYDEDSDTLHSYDGTTWNPIGAASVNVLGIADSLGVYTYYSSYTLAIASAVSGDTIEQFGNIEETGAVMVTVNKNITIQMNGYEYKNSSTSTTDTIAISGTDVRVLNGKITRINGTYGTFQNRGILLPTTGKVDLTGLVISVDNGTSASGGNIAAKVTNGTFISNGSLTTSQYSVLASTSFKGTKFNSGGGINRFGGKLEHCDITNTTGYNYLLGSDSSAYYCNFSVTDAAGLDGVLVDGGKLFYCNSYSITEAAIRIGGSTGELWYCYGYSTLNFGIEVGSGTPKGIYYSTGVNDLGSYGGRFTNIEEVKYSTFKSISGSGGVWCSASDVLIDSCVFKIEDSSSYKRGFYDSASSGTVRVYNCLVETAGSGASNQSMLFTSGRNVYLADNKIRGGSGITNPSGNSQTTATDSVGNIILD